MKNVNSDLIASIFLMLNSLIIIFFIIPKGAVSHPTPALSSAFFPKLLTYIMILLVIILLIQSLKGNNSTEYQKEKEVSKLHNKQSLKKIVLVNIVLFSYLFLLNNFGYIISTPIFLFFLLYSFGEKKIISSIIFSISMTYLVFIVFNIIMKIRLP